MERLREYYENNIKNALQNEFSYKNVMMIPRLSKIVLNMGVGEAAHDRKKIDTALHELSLICGQKAIITKAKKSIAGFKLRETSNIGVKVTLRGAIMYEFLDRLVNIAMPRIRDFRGLSKKSFDGNGNFSMGIKEHIIFPEIDFDKCEANRGMDIVMVTTAQTDAEGLALLKNFNMPFNK